MWRVSLANQVPKCSKMFQIHLHVTLLNLGGSIGSMLVIRLANQLIPWLQQGIAAPILVRHLLSRSITPCGCLGSKTAVKMGSFHQSVAKCCKYLETPETPEARTWNCLRTSSKKMKIFKKKTLSLYIYIYIYIHIYIYIY